MSKKLLLALAALAGLSGCVAVPVYDGAPGYGYGYAPPAASVTFGYYDYGPRYERYYRGPRYGDRHGYRRGHRHGGRH